MIYPYVKKNLLTDAELQFYHFMRSNLCQINKITILCKVRLADIMDVEPGFPDEFIWEICNKHIDYLICNRYDMKIICAVELDDFTHNTQQRKKRDEIVNNSLDAAGIPLVRIGKKVKDLVANDLKDIDYYINTELAPNCPFCGEKMIPSEYKLNNTRFFMCKNYDKQCKYVINIDGENLP